MYRGRGRNFPMGLCKLYQRRILETESLKTKIKKGCKVVEGNVADDRN
jgi:hypothetical protein